MKKELIKKSLIESFTQQIAEVEATVGEQRKLANDDQLKSEGKYDTRAIEAKYLADAMAKKLDDLKLDLQMLEQIPTDSSSEEIAIGSLVQLKHNQKLNWYYIGPVAGGKLVEIEGRAILIISAFSPLGSELIGQSQGDEIVVEAPNGEKEYLIKDVL